MIGELASFRELYMELMDYEGASVFDALLVPQIAPARQLLSPLASHAHLPEHPAETAAEELWQWYALSRVSDLLLLEVQRGTLPAARYAEFFAALGFAPFGVLPFNPFFHEIVEVIEDAAVSGRPIIDHVFWPGLMFGEMLFARAGVRVRCPPGLYRKDIAENSCLYFTFRRLTRRTQDLSHGWGSNSQWATAFRRDYDSGGSLYYNVDGKHPLGPDYAASFGPQGPSDDLTLNERVELLTHRGFVRCPKDDRDCWPYDDTFQEPKSAYP